MTLFLLWLLGTFDAAMSGYREAAGRSALIDKRQYYFRAMIRGALLGQLAMLIAAGTAIVVAYFSGAQPNEGLRDASARMLVVFLPFTSVIVIALIMRLLPSVDIRSITSTVVFGPLTMLRPVAAIAGLAYGLAHSPGLPVIILFVTASAMLLSMEWFLSRLRK